MTVPPPVGKRDVLGVMISVTTYEETVDYVCAAASRKEGGIVTCLPVHGVVTANRNHCLRNKINGFDFATPDGQPVRWALNLLHGAKLKNRVYGPELMARICRRAAEEGIAIYLYGSHPQVLEKLAENLTEKFPSLRIAGRESPPFRPLTAVEDKETVERIKASGAGILFLGLGCPKQDEFAHDHRNSVPCVQVCVGAAFDFIAGSKKTAPAWMQRHGLEWLFRLTQEPGRLWKRYLYTNTFFLWKILLEILNRDLK